MKINLKLILLFVVIGTALLIFFFTQIYPSRISKAEHLINEGNLREAKLLIAKYLDEDDNNKDMIELYSKVIYELVKDSCKIFEAKQQFVDAVYLIENNLPEIKDFNFTDSIKLLLIDMSLQGANYYKNNYNYFLAYDCIIPLFKFNSPLNETDKNLINEITKLMLNGIWEAVSKKADILVHLNIIAVTSKTYYGSILLFSPYDYNTYRHFYTWTLSNCSYEDMYLAAAYKLLRWSFLLGPGGEYLTNNRKNIDFLLNGKYENGKFKIWLTLPVYGYVDPDTSKYMHFTKFITDTLLFYKIK